MRIVFHIAAAVVIVATPAVLSAAGSGRQNPYSGLFSAQLNGTQAPKPPAVQLAVQAPQLPLPQPASRSRVVCGMTVAEGDSKIDPTMPHPVPLHGPKALITVIEPQICRR